jgi:hypothetical protein
MTFRLGINYWPVSSAMYWWRHFDAAEVAQDFACIRAAGMEDLEEDRRLGPGEAARVCDLLCMHGYPIYAAWATSATDALLLPFLGLIMRWLGGDKDVLFAEFGAPAMPHPDQQIAAVPATCRILDEAEAALFTRRALAALHRFGFVGAMLWCYGDYAPELWCTPPLDAAIHERSFGLWRYDYTAKPALAEIRHVADSERCVWRDTQAWIDLAADEFYTHPQAHLRRLYQRFRRHYSEEEYGDLKRPQA